MKKMFIGLLVMGVVLITACSMSGKKLTSEETDQLVGTWECIDEDWAGDLVYIKVDEQGLSFQYEDEDKVSTQFSSKSDEDDGTLYTFESKKNKLRYNLLLKKNKNIILNRSTTKPETAGTSAPMEYKRISK